MTNNYQNDNSQGRERERRRFIRLPFQKNIKYRICYDKFNSDNVEANSENISSDGILFKTKWPPPVMSILAVNIDLQKLRSYIENQNLNDQFNYSSLYVQNGMLYGEVIRIKEYPESGYYDVALKLIRKSDAKKTPDVQTS